MRACYAFGRRSYLRGVLAGGGLAPPPCFFRGWFWRVFPVAFVFLHGFLVAFGWVWVPPRYCLGTLWVVWCVWLSFLAFWRVVFSLMVSLTRVSWRRVKQINRGWEDIGWTIHRFWEEELKDFRATAE